MILRTNSNTRLAAPNATEYLLLPHSKALERIIIFLVRFVKIFMICLGVESVVCELSIPVCATTFFEWCASMVFLLWKDMLNLNMSDLVKKPRRRYVGVITATTYYILVAKNTSM